MTQHPIMDHQRIAPLPRRPLPRRRALVQLSLVLAGAGSLAATLVSAELEQPETPGPVGFAERAFEMRRLSIERGDQPYGAVVVKDGLVVGEGVSAVVTSSDPTAHAEMEAIRDAARRLGSADLSGAELYGSSRACPMCTAAAYWARIARLYFGSAPSDGGAPRLC